MVRLSETLGVHSVEDFLTGDECRLVVEVMAEHMRLLPERALSETARATSVHSTPGVSLERTMAAYEPAGRREVTPVPAAVTDVLETAVKRSLHAIQRVFPSVRGAGHWTYLEYGVGQHITPHIDHPVEVQPTADGAPPPSGPLGDLTIDAHPLNVSGISVLLSQDHTGGEFFVETSSSDEIWRTDRAELVHEGADHTADWFPRVPRTRWTSAAPAGTAVLYGTQLTHGTAPVLTGVARKLIGFVL